MRFKIIIVKYNTATIKVQLRCEYIDLLTITIKARALTLIFLVERRDDIHKMMNSEPKKADGVL